MDDHALQQVLLLVISKTTNVQVFAACRSLNRYFMAFTAASIRTRLAELLPAAVLDIYHSHELSKHQPALAVKKVSCEAVPSR